MEFLLNYGLEWKDLEELTKKFNNSLINNIINQKENVIKIITFLVQNNVDIIEELLLSYLELFTYSIDTIKIKLDKLKDTFGDNWLEAINEDVSLLGIVYDR